MERDAIREKVAEFPASPGVYMMKDAAGVVVYIGKAKSLRARVGGYFQPGARHDEKTSQMVLAVADVDFVEAPSEVDAFLMESRLIKDVQPKYNVRLRDAKSFPFLQITTGEDYPRVEITRTPLANARLFGPFTHAKELRPAVGLMQQVFRFRTCSLDICDDDPRRRYARPCLLHHIERCLAPCAARCTRAAYDTAISTLIRFLSGKREGVLKELERQMLKASREFRFEDAAAFRDEMKALKSLDKRSRFTDNPEFYEFAVNFKNAGAALAEVFGRDDPIRLIEGIDISDIGGADAVGSLVSFIDGAAFRSGYRRYKIRTVDRNDDYAMIREVVTRRYRRLKEEDVPLPDLILIDGGKGHLSVAAEALAGIGVEPPLLASIAKKEEEIFRVDCDEPLRLPRRSKALRLLQFVRDEAHRFALHYHHILRTKRTLGTKADRRRRKKVRIAVDREKPGPNENEKT